MRLPPYRLGVPCDSSAHVRKRDRSNMTPPSRPERFTERGRSKSRCEPPDRRQEPRRQRAGGSRLSAALADLFILVRQRHRRALCRRIHSAGHDLGHPLAFVILLPFAAVHLIRDWPLIKKHAGFLTLLALTGFSAYNTMAYYGLHFTTAINGLLLQSVSPLFVALWSFVLFRDYLSLRQAAGIAVSLVGVGVIVCHGSLQILLATAFNKGDLWFVVALLIYAFYIAILRLRPPIHPLSFLAVGMGGGAVLLLPAMALEIAA